MAVRGSDGDSAWPRAFALMEEARANTSDYQPSSVRTAATPRHWPLLRI